MLVRYFCVCEKKLGESGSIMSSIVQIDTLLEKYSGNLPRYTSYPTALELKPVSDLNKVQDAMSKVNAKPLSLYLHIPFCPSLCYFCACNKIVTQDLSRFDDYLRLVEIEAALISKAAAGKLKISQLHLGGGSPSYLSVQKLNELFVILRRYFNFLPGAERSIEIDPRTIDNQKIAAFVKEGFSRVSLGVQDFDDQVQALIHRRQTFELVEEVVQELRRAFIPSINFDLIYGLPGQTLQSFERTIQQVIKLRPNRIALYGYAHVVKLHKVQKVFEKANLPKPKLRLQLFERARELLLENGYLFIGLDHFVLPGDELHLAFEAGRLKRNFMGYTVIDGSGVLGLGVSSISDIANLLFQNFTDYSQYRSALEQGQLPIWKECVRSPETIIRAAIIEKIMCDARVDFERIALEAAALIDTSRIVAEGIRKLRPFIEDRLVNADERHLEVTPLGRYFLRHLASCFDSNLSLQANKIRFSQSL